MAVEIKPSGYRVNWCASHWDTRTPSPVPGVAPDRGCHAPGARGITAPIETLRLSRRQRTECKASLDKPLRRACFRRFALPAG
jgi:hypothetical protein